MSPETTETGVEMTKAQGQATTSNVSPRTNHWVNGPPNSSGGMELPRVPRGRTGRPYRYAYGQATDRDGANGLVKVDCETGQATEWWEQGVYVEEPIPIQRPEGDAEDDGVVVATALDVDRERTLLLVFDAETLTVAARAVLPHAEPFGFHGRFFPDVVPE